MNLYLISIEDWDYDYYDSAIVASETEEEAKNIHPNGDIMDWKKAKEDFYDNGWTKEIEKVKCKLIGTAIEGIPKGVICASFNAG